MREIKFRGKKDYRNGWVYGNLIQFDWADFIVKYGSFEERQRVIPSTVGQFIGTPDKNGKEVYEGDIVRHINRNEEYTVAFDDMYNCRFVLIVQDGSHIPISSSIFRIFCEVVGNIHDNPELLTNNK